MGMPEMVISFSDAARTFLQRFSRGIVALVVKDSTAAGAITRIKAGDDISELFTDDNIAYINSALNAGASEVIAVRYATSTAATLPLITGLYWNWLAMPEAVAADTTSIVSYIAAQRTAGKTFKAVVYDATAPNNAGVVNFTTTGLKDLEGESVASAAYTAKLAGLLAGLPLDRSATFYPLDDLSEITESTTPDADIDAGELILTYDREVFKIARAVTSFTSGTGVSREFKKIKHVEGCDMIADDIRRIFEDEYVGQVPNSYDNKQVLVAAINGYLSALEGTVLDTAFENNCEVDAYTQLQYLNEIGVDTSGMEEQEILEANTDSAVFLRMDIKLLDAMEDMTLAVTIN